MAENIGEVGVTVNADTSNIEKQIVDAFTKVGQEAAKNLSKALSDALGPGTTKPAEESAKKIGTSYRDLAQVLGDAFAVKKILDFGKASFAQAEEAQKIGAQTAAVLRSTGDAANVTLKQIEDLANAESRKIGVDDELIQRSENLLLTFTNVRNRVGENNDTFSRAVPLIQDMAAAMGGDATGAATLLGKALNDPTVGMLALQRAGVRLSDQQKEQIQLFLDQGKVAEAQGVILDEVAKRFGGSAEAQATAVGKARVAIQNLEESVGKALLPTIELAANIIGRLADAFSSLPQPLQLMVAFGAAGAVAIHGVAKAIDLVTGTRQGLSRIVDTFGQMKNGAGEANSALGTLGGTFAVVAGGIAAAVAINSVWNNQMRDAAGLLKDVEKGTASLDDVVLQFTKDQRSGLNAFTDGKVIMADFKAILEQSAPAAQYLTDKLREQGQNVDEYQALIDKTTANQKQWNDIQAESALAAGDTTDAVSAQKDAFAWLAADIQNATAQGEAVGRNWDENQQRAKDLADSVKALTDSVTAYVDGLFVADDQNEKIADAWDKVAQSVYDNGAAIDVNTRAGRANRDAIEDLVKSQGDYLVSLGLSTGAGQDFRDTVATQADALYQTLLQLGFNAETAAYYRDALLSVPDKITTTIVLKFQQEVFPNAQPSEANRYAAQLDAMSGDPLAAKKLADPNYDWANDKFSDPKFDPTSSRSAQIKAASDKIAAQVAAAFRDIQAKAAGRGGAGGAAGSAGEAVGKSLTDGIVKGVEDSAPAAQKTVYQILDDMFRSFSQAGGSQIGPIGAQFETLAKGFASGATFQEAIARLNAAVGQGLVPADAAREVYRLIQQQFVDQATKYGPQTGQTFLNLSGLSSFYYNPMLKQFMSGTGPYTQGQPPGAVLTPGPQINVNVMVDNVSYGNVYDVASIVGQSVAQRLAQASIGVGVAQGSG